MSDEIEPRRSPYIWPTWITGLMSGDKQCWYQAWFKAHHFKYPKVEDRNANALTQWKADHAALVARTAARLNEQGWTVTLEDQNKINVKGESATVGGKPDIVAVQPGVDEALIADCKSGRRRDSDYWQVVTYIALSTLKKARLHGKSVSGLVVYPSADRVVTPRDAREAGPTVFSTIKTLGSSLAPAAVPSAEECGRCDIACCAYRAKPDAETEPVETEEF